MIKLLKNVNFINLLKINDFLYDIMFYDEVRDVNIMLLLAKSILAIFVGFLVSVIFGVIFVPFMKRTKARQVTSKFVKAHSSKTGTPTMGGLIFTISTIITIIALFLKHLLYQE